MKILHLNTHSYGGAAVVARRLHRAALASGLDSTFITKFGLRSDQTVSYRALRDARVLYALRQRAADPRLYRIGKFVQRRMQHRNLVNRPAGFEIFSPLNTRHQFADCTESTDPNVVHLHWVAGFVDHEQFFQRNRARKFVWTLHDMNPFTGGCHHADGCGEFARACASCPQLAGTVDPAYGQQVLQAKARALSALRDEQLTIVAPSRWLLELSQQSPVTGRFRHVHIDNPSFDAADFADAHTLRHALGLPAGKKIIVFVSDNLRNPRKGLPLLFDAVRLLPRPQDVHLVGVGQRADAPDDLSVSYAGAIADEGLLARYLSCADVLVNTSVAENAPLTIIEALSCGTPVVAFRIGGIPELVTTEDGALAAERTAQALADTLDDALFRRQYDRAGIRQRARRYAPVLVIEQYKKVYSELTTS